MTQAAVSSFVGRNSFCYIFCAKGKDPWTTDCQVGRSVAEPIGGKILLGIMALISSSVKRMAAVVDVDVEEATMVVM